MPAWGHTDQQLWKVCVCPGPTSAHAFNRREGLQDKSPIYLPHWALKTMVLENTLEHRVNQIQMAEL